MGPVLWAGGGQGRDMPKGMGLKGHVGREVFLGEIKFFSWWRRMSLTLGSLDEM